ncbi:S41 family peptidase [Nafulsella turpanensis]|uniref:S41 family peptidase n=1 Tax=Nafulsella turpanensis TaxID=1265690 RepID=UPI001F2EB1E4|nr:S41 family peptidase [Nafulsella turpanensis]
MIGLLFIFVMSLPVLAQEKASLSEAEKDEIIKNVSALLIKNYVFPDKAREMATFLRKQNKKDAYQQQSTYQEFAQALHRDLQRTHRDLHLGLHYNPRQVAFIRQWESQKQDSAFQQEQIRMAERLNFGFVKVEHLPGNIGYIDFRQFAPPEKEARQTVASAMGFVRNADALIIDLRKNGGGHPEMVQLIMSYFFKEKPIHYNSLYDRPTNTTKDYYTLKTVEGPRMPEVELYVLTSGFTFSAAEELTYNLQTQKRATIVGEVTGGGAHPTQSFAVNDDLVLNVPVARAINAVTKTNWEGRGVMPDIPSEADKALLKARYLALAKLRDSSSSSMERAELSWELNIVEAELHPIQLSHEELTPFAGRYGDRKLLLYEDGLYFQEYNYPKKKMTPLTKDTFSIQDLDYLRVKGIKNEDGSIWKLLLLYQDGRTEEVIRIE